MEKGSFQKSPFSRDLENFEILEILENSQTVANKGEPDHFLEILENLETLTTHTPLIKGVEVHPLN